MPSVSMVALQKNVPCTSWWIVVVMAAFLLRTLDWFEFLDAIGQMPWFTGKPGHALRWDLQLPHPKTFHQSLMEIIPRTATSVRPADGQSLQCGINAPCISRLARFPTLPLGKHRSVPDDLQVGWQSCVYHPAT